MASYTVASGQRGVHKTLVASTVDTVTFDGDSRRVEIVNRDGSAEIYFTVDNSTPVVGANATQVIPAAISSWQLASPERSIVIKLISTGGPAYSVQEAS